MISITSLYKVESARFFSKINVLILLVLILVLMISIFTGFNEYNYSIAYCKKSQAAEIVKKRLHNITRVYSLTGVKIMYDSSPNMLFFSNHDSMGNIIGRVNSTGTIEIKNDRKGEPFISHDSLFTFRFANILFLFFSVVSLFLGYNAVQDKEYLKFISSLSSHNAIILTRVFIGIFLLSICLLFAYVWCVGYLLLLGFQIGGINFPNLLWHAFQGILMISFFFVSGIFLGSIRTKIGGYATLTLWWFCMAVFIPNLINSIMIEKPLNLESVTLDAEKEDIIEKFEQSTEKKYGKFDENKMPQERMIIEGYKKNELKRIEALEEHHKAKIVPIYKSYNNLSLFFPVSFYNITSSEVSSRGYENYLTFYSYLQILCREFTIYIIDRDFYDKPWLPKYFPQGNKDLFKAKSRLPENFGLGIAYTLGWIFIMGGFSLFLFKRSLYKPTKAECTEVGKLTENWPKGEWEIFYVRNESFKNILYTLLSKQNHRWKKDFLQGDILYDKNNLIQDNIKKTFLYLCKPSDIHDDIHMKHLLGVVTANSGISKEEKQAFLERPELQGITGKKWGQLTIEEKFNALLALTYVIKRDIYLINDIAPEDQPLCIFKLKERLAILKNESLVIYLTSNMIAVFPDINYTVVYQNCSEFWGYKIAYLKEHYDAKEKLAGTNNVRRIGFN